MRSLTDAQGLLAERRAQSTVQAAAVLVQRAAGTGGFVSIRDARAAAEQAGTDPTDSRAEREMVRAAGFGRLKTSGLLGDWEAMVNAADEAARWHETTIELAAVSRASLAWCLADRPKDDPIAALSSLSRDIVTDDVHDERIEATYRSLLDGWSTVLAPT